MSNSYNSCPIRIDTTFTGGWRAAQTLNVGNLPSNIQQTSGSVSRQWGIQVVDLLWTSPGAAASVSITDPKDSTVLAMYDTPAGYTGGDISITPLRRSWRDFNVTISTGVLFINYRA